MKIPGNNERELEAAWIVAAMLGSTQPVRRDSRGSPDRTHDFDIVIADTVVALEVSSTTVPEVAAMWKVIGQIDWQSPELPQSWSISLRAAERGRAGPAVRAFREQSLPLLLQVHRDDPLPPGDLISEPQKYALSQVATDGIRHLRNLGALSGGPIGTMTGMAPSICVGTIGSWTSDISSVLGAVERESVNIAEKLASAHANERHLFLWVDDTDPSSVEELTNFQLPAEQPDLPAGIDTVWVALWLRNPDLQTNAYALWRVGRTSEWEIVPVPQVRSYAKAVGARL